MTRKEKWLKACRECSKHSTCKRNCNVRDRLWQEWKLEETLKERGYSDPEEIDKEIKRLLG